MRASQGAFVVEGPRVVAAALDRHASLERVYVGTGATTAFAPLVERHGLRAGEGDAALVAVQRAFDIEGTRTAAPMEDKGRASICVARERALEHDCPGLDTLFLDG